MTSVPSSSLGSRTTSCPARSTTSSAASPATSLVNSSALANLLRQSLLFSASIPIFSLFAFAFAVFSDQQSAINAMHAVNGLMFDLEKESTLYIDIAKSNSRYSRSKRSRTDDETTRFSDKKVKGPGAFSRGLPDSGVGSNVHLSGMGNSAHSMNGFPPAQSQGNFDPEAGIDTNLKKFSNNSPCPTLFVANLGLNCTEQGLNQIFSSCPGFLKLKMQNKRGVPVAFVDFQDVASSTVALRFLQGSPQFSLDGEGMRLEYAKSRMGMRKRERRS
ncbi:hypothetical protein MRB53_017347 [Persea americana]|uniref:Uncharacterized protein n=1 Tax=Persea americana TaxID=3435 RepID=A0ACC2M5F4_PERAE|nr:hypothetical protein MRB53_017347 [Persea americana]